MSDCLSPRSASSSVPYDRLGSASESIESDYIRPSFPRAIYGVSYASSSMDGEDRDRPARMAVQDAAEDFNLARVAKNRSRLKIVFVDSRPHRRSARVRRNPTRAAQQSENPFLTAEQDNSTADPDARANYVQREASEDETDQAYNDDEARLTKKPRAGRNTRHQRQQKRHGRLTAADRDLMFAAQHGGLAYKTPKNKAGGVSKSDAINLIASIAEKIDWRQAVAVQQEMQKTCDEPLAKSGMPDSERKSVLSKVDGDTALADFQLKQYWSDVLVSSVLGMKTK